MSVKWKRTKSELRNAEGRDFERKVLPFLRIIWSDTILPQPLRTHDKSGVDILRWKRRKDKSIPLAVQCKGFRVGDSEMGKDQVRQCEESIDTFIKSGFKADVYILIHNREPNSDFQRQVELKLNELKKLGRVKEAYVWDYLMLIRQAGDKVRERCRQYLSLNEPKANKLSLDKPLCAPLEQVPIEIFEMVFNRNQKVSETFIAEKVSDPAQELIRTHISNRSLVLAKAGYGKTTSALRTFQFSDKRIFYLSAASLPRDGNNKDSLFKSWLTFDEMYEQVSDEDFPVLELLISPALDYLLKDAKQPVILILDALDESIYFSRPHGLQDLFNHIADVKVPVILLAREEYWATKQEQFATSFGQQAVKQDKNIKTKVTVIRLKDWGKEQIKAFAERYKTELKGAELANLDDFINLVKSDSYEQVYGDIPKRPLFLNYILESVAIEGIKSKSKAKLFYDWVCLKIKRDFRNPIQAGGEGRKSILHNRPLDNEDEVLRLSFKIMKIAASKMTIIQNKRLELLPFCDIEEIKGESPDLAFSLDAVGLFLHSLLEQEKSTAERQTVKFSHRTYQEFFLALFIRDNPNLFENVSLPEAIETQLAELKGEEF
jgi:hypothetical protein